MMRAWKITVLAAVSLAVSSWAPTRADITVKGTVYYWNDDVENADGTTGAYVTARRLHVQAENDRKVVGDIDTYTDADGKYEVTFKQQPYQPEFTSLKINIEVRASVWLDAVLKPGAVNPANTVSVFKGAVRLYPYNGQTRSVEVQNGNTVTINVYVAPPEKPYAETSMNGRYNLPISSWDHDDDGRRTLAGIFMCQSCAEEYRFLCDRAADKKELARSTSIFYPESKSAYRDTQSPAHIQGLSESTGWIDISYYKLFDADKPGAGEKWQNWRILRCTVMHEFGHKLMHDVYWTMPKTHPFMSGAHDVYGCASGEMGWREGWAHFLPAAVLELATMRGQPLITDTVMAPGAPGEEPTPIVSVVKNTDNIEHAWYPNLAQGEAFRAQQIPGDIGWREKVTGRRDWNELEVAAVLWDVYDPPGWEYMPKAQQDNKPAGWPGHLMWYERLSDSNLNRIWEIVKKQPEALNDEDEEVYRDSFWTYWLKEYGNDDELVHGLKAIFHNRDIRHTMKLQTAPKILSVRILPGCSTVLFADVTVWEADKEDRPFLYYNVGCDREGGPLTLMHETDRPLEGVWDDDRLSARIRLPARDRWDRLIVMVHDSMDRVFLESGGEGWRDDSQGAGPRLRLINASPKDSGPIVAIGSGGTVWAWGRNQYGFTTPFSPSARFSGGCVEKDSRANQVRGMSDAVGVAATIEPVYVALKSDGTVWTWGKSSKSVQLGIGAEKPAADYLPNQVPGLTNIVAIDAAIGSYVALRADGAVFAWGYHARQSDGTLAGRWAPVQIQGLPHDQPITGISAGYGHALAVDRSGRVWRWDTRETPEQLEGLSDIVDVVAAPTGPIGTSLALDRHGAVWEINSHDYFTGTRTDRKPGRVPGLSKIIAIAGGGGFGLRVALDQNGRIWTWARDNEHGKLGDPNRKTPEECIKPAPVAFGAMSDGWIAIAAGGNFGAALHRQGFAFTWGHGLARGDGEQADIATPLPRAVMTHTYRPPTRLWQPATDFIPTPLWFFH